MGIATKFLSSITIILMIFAILTGKVSFSELEKEAVSVGWIALGTIFAIVKSFVIYIILAIAIALTLFAIIIDLIFSLNTLNILWNFAWNDMAVNWFWNDTPGILLIIGLAVLGLIFFVVGKD